MVATFRRLRTDRALNPGDFCRKYSRHNEGNHGYKSKWAQLLSHVLGISTKTIETWGSPPNYGDCPEPYQRRLAEIDALKTAEAVLKANKLDQEYLDQLGLSDRIDIPDNLENS